MTLSKNTVKPVPYAKTPLQLQHWAAYEAITAQRAIEANAKAAEQRNAGALLDSAGQWARAAQIRTFVEATMCRVASDADTVTLANALQWRDWALGVATSLDHAQLQADSFRIGTSPLSTELVPVG